MLRIDNISFGANMKVGCYNDRWKSIAEKFNQETMNQHSNLTINVVQTCTSSNNYVILLNKDEMEVHGYLSDSVSSKLLKLNDIGVVNKFIKIINTAFSFNPNFIADCKNFAQKWNLKDDALKYFQNVVTAKNFEDLNKKFDTDDVLSGIEFNGHYND